MKKVFLAIAAIILLSTGMIFATGGKKGAKTSIPKGSYMVNTKDSTFTVLRSDSAELSSLIPAGFKLTIKPR